MRHFSSLMRTAALLFHLSGADELALGQSKFSNWSAILNQVRDISKERHRRHRSYEKIGRSMRDCMLALNKSASLPSMVTVHEPEALRYRMCTRATTWGATGDEQLREDQTQRHHPLLVVIAAYIRNEDNARIFSLSLRSIKVFQPNTEILIVDNGSPTKELLLKAVDECRITWRGEIHVVAGQTFRALDKNVSNAIINRTMMTLRFADRISMPQTREIGALRATVLFVEQRLRTMNITPPRYIAFLLHSTGLRMPLPMGEIADLARSETCHSFPLDVPWFRYEPTGGLYVDSRYGLDNRLAEYLMRKTLAIPSTFSKNSKPNELWRGATHGAFVLQWSTLRDDFRKMGLLSDLARDQCGGLNCCCWEQFSGMAMDWLAPGNKAWREGWANHVQTVTPERIRRPGRRGAHWPPELDDPSYKPPPVQDATGTLRDLRCIFPVLWKLHGRNTETEFRIPRDHRLRQQISSMRIAEAMRERDLNTSVAQFFAPETDQLPDFPILNENAALWEASSNISNQQRSNWIWL